MDQLSACCLRLLAAALCLTCYLYYQFGCPPDLQVPLWKLSQVLTILASLNITMCILLVGDEGIPWWFDNMDKDSEGNLIPTALTSSSEDVEIGGDKGLAPAQEYGQGREYIKHNNSYVCLEVKVHSRWTPKEGLCSNSGIKKSCYKAYKSIFDNTHISACSIKNVLSKFGKDSKCSWQPLSDKKDVTSTSVPPIGPFLFSLSSQQLCYQYSVLDDDSISSKGDFYPKERYDGPSTPSRLSQLAKPEMLRAPAPSSSNGAQLVIDLCYLLSAIIHYQCFEILLRQWVATPVTDDGLISLVALCLVPTLISFVGMATSLLQLVLNGFALCQIHQLYPAHLVSRAVTL